MNKLARIMEYFWLTLAVVSAIWVTYLILTEGWAKNKLLIWFPLVCVATFLYRRFMRKKMTEWAQRRAEEEQRQAP